MPRQMRETCRPVRPRRVYCIAAPPWAVAARRCWPSAGVDVLLAQVAFHFVRLVTGMVDRITQLVHADIEHPAPELDVGLAGEVDDANTVGGTRGLVHEEPPLPA